MLCVPTPNHRKLVDGCYPPAKNIVGIENPNSNELGKLVYYAQSKPAKLTKIGKVLEDRAAADAKAVSASGISVEKGRCGLLITLTILKSLITECSRDVTYVSSSAQLVLHHALTAAEKAAPHRSRDLELSARASSAFFAFASALDPFRTSVDEDQGGSYLSLLRQFGKIALEQSDDFEDRNRLRLIGLGALSGAVGSEAFYGSSFSQQVEIIVPTLLANIQAGMMPIASLDAEAQKTVVGTPSFSEFVFAARVRPGHRKVPSLSGHIAGEKGPNTIQVVSATMGILQGIFRHAGAIQVQDTMKLFFKWMGGRDGSPQWNQKEWACLITKTICRWTSLPYRFVVLTSMIEYLVEHCEGPSQTRHATLLTVISEILKAKDLTLIGLSTSETLNNLAGLAVRRVHFDVKDPLLPQVVECIESLACHVYYAEQINDIADELVARILALSQAGYEVGKATKTSHLGRTGGVVAETKSGERQKMESIRVLLFALTRVIVVANSPEGSRGEGNAAVEENGKGIDKTRGKGKDAGPTLGIIVAGTRSKIQPDILTPTAGLLASHDASVRLAEAQLLVTYLQREAGQLSASSSEAASLAHGISAAAYVAAVSPALRVHASAANDATPSSWVVAIDRSLLGGRVSPAADAADAAVPVDYSALSEILGGLSSQKYSVAGLFAVVPALFAIDHAAATKLVPDASSAPIIPHRRRACRLLLAKVWLAIGRQWDIALATREAESVLSSLSDYLPLVPPPLVGLSLPEQCEIFPQTTLNGEGSGAASAVFNQSVLARALSQSAKVQDASGLNPDALQRLFERDWSASMAVDEADVGASSLSDDLNDDVALDGSSSVQGHAGSSLQLNTVKGGYLAAAPALPDANGTASTRSGVSDLCQTLGSKAYGSSSAQRSGSESSYNNGGVAELGKGLHPMVGIAVHPGNGSSSNEVSSLTPVPLSAAERRANKRASRGAMRQVSKSAGATAGSNGNADGSKGAARGEVGGLLDSLGIASSATVEEDERRALVPPYVA